MNCRFTGSGKLICINTIITSIIYNAKPSEVKFVMVDKNS
ncbi:MAG: FtsK/SpoIIIE domain-containing protein [Clostridia bacterium]